MTRFYVLFKDAPNAEVSDRMVFSATGDASCLPDLMEVIVENDIELVSLHDRPEMTVLGNYVYLIECANTGYDGFEKLAVVDGFEFHYYGAFYVK